MGHSLDYGRSGRLTQCIEVVSSLGPIMLGTLPYLASLLALRSANPLIQQTAERFEIGRLGPESGGCLWVGDKLKKMEHVRVADHIGGVGRDGVQFGVLTCRPEPEDGGSEVRNFVPVGELDLFADGSPGLPFPPFLEICRYIADGEFSELLLPSPGTLGLTGLLAGSLMGLKCTGVYHNNFSSDVRSVLHDENLKPGIERYCGWFLRKTDRVLAFNPDDLHDLRRLGVEREKITLVAGFEEDPETREVSMTAGTAC
jgi:hypothetical protein